MCVCIVDGKGCLLKLDTDNHFHLWLAPILATPTQKKAKKINHFLEYTFKHMNNLST